MKKLIFLAILPREDEGKRMNFETDEEFELDFEIGISPEFELKLSKKQNHRLQDYYR